MKRIFLSASIPLENRDKIYYSSADVTAIRDAVLALVKVCLTDDIRIVWGGHPAITPLVYQAIKQYTDKQDSSDYFELEKDIIKKYVTIYQSDYYKDQFPPDNAYFDNIVSIPAEDTEESSQKKMREVMLDNDFVAAVFIGGMDGVVKEYEMVVEKHPDIPCLPIASTGAAAKIVYERERQRKQIPEDLLTNYAYKSLFHKLLNDAKAES